MSRSRFALGSSSTNGGAGATSTVVSTTHRLIQAGEATEYQPINISLGDLLTARPSGLTEPECWAILCQAVQALQDLFLSDGASGDSCIPLVTPSTLMLSSRGRVELCQSSATLFGGRNTNGGAGGVCLQGGASVAGLPPPLLAGYLAPEYRPNKEYSDTEAEKMWIYALGETLKRATLTSHAATLKLSSVLCQVMTNMTKTHTAARASLMHLLEIISEYCKRRQQNRPFSHIVMDLHQEAMAAIEARLDTPWGPPAMPELRPRTTNSNRCDSTTATEAYSGRGTNNSTLPRRWINLLTRNQDLIPSFNHNNNANNINEHKKSTKEASTSMEDISAPSAYNNTQNLQYLTSNMMTQVPGCIVRPKSMCVVPNSLETNATSYYNPRVNDNNNLNGQFFGACSMNDVTSRAGTAGQYEVIKFTSDSDVNSRDFLRRDFEVTQSSESVNCRPGRLVTGGGAATADPASDFHVDNNIDFHNTEGTGTNRRLKVRRNPVHRAASRLYRANNNDDDPSSMTRGEGRGGATEPITGDRGCIGPEFVVRASLPSKQIIMSDSKGNHHSNKNKNVTVILLNGQKLDVLCNPNSTTAGQLFEIIIQKEHIEENFMLGLSALIAGDFVFLPSDTRICKAMQKEAHSVSSSPLTLFMRVRFFLPSLRGIRGAQARHLLYLQLRRSILEHQLPCSFVQLIELDGLALQIEFGDFSEREHGTRDYFLMEHYVPETMSCAIDDQERLRQELIRSHKSKRGLDGEKAKQDFIALAQSLPHYGGHFYTATWCLKDNNHKDVWLYISAQGINLYERDRTTSNCGPQLYENFEWRTIQTLCYSKHYLCVLPHTSTLHSSKLKKYKLKMDHKKSYFTFRLASLHHQFFLRLRTEYTSLQSLSQQFGIPLKDIKNESNSLCKLTNPCTSSSLDQATVNAETEFKIEFRASSKCSTNTNRAATQADFLDRGNSGDDRNGWKNLAQQVVRRRAKSVNDFSTLNPDLDMTQVINEEFQNYQNKENENPSSENHQKNSKNNSGALILESCYLSGLNQNFSTNATSCATNSADKRRGAIKMGTRAFYQQQNNNSNSMVTNNNSNNNNNYNGSSRQKRRISRSMEAVNATGNYEYLEEMSLQSVSLHCSDSEEVLVAKSPHNMDLNGGASCDSNEAYVIDASVKSCTNNHTTNNNVTQNQFPLPDFQESISDSLLEKFDNISYLEERHLSTVCIDRDGKNSLGVQITEGSDGNVYVQSVILGGPAHLTGNVLSGDQVIAVNGRSLLGMRYTDALEILRNTGHRVEFVLSRILPCQSTSRRTQDAESNTSRSRINLSNINELHLKSVRLDKTLEKLKAHQSQSFSTRNYDESYNSATSTGYGPSSSERQHQLPAKNRENFEFLRPTGYGPSSPVEKHVTESCHDISNLSKKCQQAKEVPYHKHIRYEIEPENLRRTAKKLVRTEIKSPVMRPVVMDTKNNANCSVLSKSKSCSQIYVEKSGNFDSPTDDRAVIVDMIPKTKAESCLSLNRGTSFMPNKCLSLDRRIVKSLGGRENCTAPADKAETCNFGQKFYPGTIPPIALPRSLGLSRKWRGPVKYPVTPVKKSPGGENMDKMVGNNLIGDREISNNYFSSTSDEEQVFI